MSEREPTALERARAAAEVAEAAGQRMVPDASGSRSYAEMGDYSRTAAAAAQAWAAVAQAEAAERSAPPKLPQWFVEMTAETNRKERERLAAVAAYHAAHPAGERLPCADVATGLPRTVADALEQAVTAESHPITWLTVGGDRWCVLRTSSGDGNRVTVDVLRVERAYDAPGGGELVPYYRREDGARETEVARLAEKCARLERMNDAMGDAILEPLPETVPNPDPVRPHAAIEILRLRVKYEALKQDRRKSGLFSDEIVDRIEAEALRARGMEP